MFGLIFCTLPAEATLITIEIEAEVDHVNDRLNLLEGRINVGDIITGSYTYESTTPDSNPLPFVGDYWQSDPASGISLNAGGFEFKTDPADIKFLVEIGDNSQSGDDYYISSYNNVPFRDVVAVNQISWHLGDPTGTALSSIALPTTAPVLDDWDSNYLYINGGPRGGDFIITGHVTSAVPEPATLLLFSLVALFLRKRK